MYYVRLLVTAFEEVDLPALSSNRFRTELTEVMLSERLPVLPPTEGHHDRRSHALLQQVRSPRSAEVVNRRLAQI